MGQRARRARSVAKVAEGAGYLVCSCSQLHHPSSKISSKNRRKESIVRSIVLVLVAISGITACQTTSVGGSDVQLTWQDAVVAIPDAYRSEHCSGRATTDCLERLDPTRKLPVVVYMHGCSGPTPVVVGDFLKLGYVTVAPNSLARA